MNRHAARGFARLEWSVLDWNESAIGFYKAFGGEAQEDTTIHRLTGDAARQKEHYIAMQRAMADNPPGYIAYAVNFACAYRNAVRDVKTHPMRWFDLRFGSIG